MPMWILSIKPKVWIALGGSIFVLGYIAFLLTTVYFRGNKIKTLEENLQRVELELQACTTTKSMLQAEMARVNAQCDMDRFYEELQAIKSSYSKEYSDICDLRMKERDALAVSTDRRLKECLAALQTFSDKTPMDITCPDVAQDRRELRDDMFKVWKDMREK